ncbi:MAG TPA: GTP-sensing pleiotropic transcriptional regulator CodY [Firmicutes bacterium]|jgi:transcriptional pleiotropic repressor|nr:GTP-sensing pleiotropic transcriptional regulator CodY [Bacillota bacterium]HBK67723.1 GTP-sensing pleiotropic transcriptional regulator CodY [Bacillota bacterium]
MSKLEQVRQLRALVEKKGATEDLETAASSIGEILRSNIYIVENNGEIVASYCGEGEDCTKQKEPLKLNPQFQQRLAFIFQPAMDLPLEACLFNEGNCYTKNVLMTIYPLQMNGQRLGNLLLTKREKSFTEDELYLVETAAIVVGVLLNGINFGKQDADLQLKTNVKVALDSLSYSELEAITNVFHELGGDEGFLVASRVADRIGITRSVIVNAMRKLESAGVVESRSLGMKGTYMKVNNPYFLEELGKRSKI